MTNKKIDINEFSEKLADLLDLAAESNLSSYKVAYVLASSFCLTGLSSFPDDKTAYKMLNNCFNDVFESTLEHMECGECEEEETE